MDVDTSMIIGMFLISGITAIALLDSRATHSFISESFVKRLGITASTIETQLAIALPSGQELQTDQIVRGCPIYVQGHQMYAELIVLKITDFDVILGMDWLSKYRVNIDCGIKMIKFAPIGAEPFTVASASISLPLRIISCMKACKLLQKGCQGYLASVLTSDPPVRELKDTDVVCEFPEVFSDDVTGLPPDREIEFVIDVVAGTHPISKDPYRIAPTEMKN
ncbi:uncharacterized protein LOC142541853 [Primulina tabacum]|uniref:uncharacterized protein LOC142541853 n=1 Tax=Primulina tabacum TaxID=48773 RepID=UPI003F5A5F18